MKSCESTFRAADRTKGNGPNAEQRSGRNEKGVKEQEAGYDSLFAPAAPQTCDQSPVSAPLA